MYAVCSGNHFRSLCMLRKTGYKNGLLGACILNFSNHMQERRLSMDVIIPQDVTEILAELNRHGFEAFAVGGCVRDMILGREPGDWDITTSAKPEQVKAVFGRTIDTGIEHGTVTVMRNQVGYEVTTYRIDGEYEDGRHPKSVEFTSNLQEDLKRRDFTINAMAYSPETGIVDLFGGMKDLKLGVIRCVGEPEERFSEDALRILRAIRFSAQLGFSIEEQTYEAVCQIAHNLVHVSKERIQVELTKLLLSDHPENMKLVFESGISPYISKEFHSLKGKPVAVSPGLPRQKALRWGAFLTNVSQQTAVNILKDLKLDNDTISRVKVFNQWWDVPLEEDPVHMRTVMSQMDPELFDQLLLLKESLASDQEHMRRLYELRDQIRENGDCISLKQLAVTGSDLIALGMKPGKEIGETLKRMLQLVLEQPEKNEKEYLLSLLKN